jgi:hypothetical protein
MYLWMALEVAFLILAALLMLKGEPIPAIFCGVLGIYAQNCRILEGNKIREHLKHYGIRVNS